MKSYELLIDVANSFLKVMCKYNFKINKHYDDSRVLIENEYVGLLLHQESQRDGGNCIIYFRNFDGDLFSLSTLIYRLNLEKEREANLIFNVLLKREDVLSQIAAFIDKFLSDVLLGKLPLNTHLNNYQVKINKYLSYIYALKKDDDLYIKFQNSDPSWKDNLDKVE